MEFIERLSQDIVKILHNSKNSIIRDVSNWSKQSHHEQLVLETPSQSFVYYAGRRYNEDENPSIFGGQPMSEYSRQPLPKKPGEPDEGHEELEEITEDEQAQRNKEAAEKDEWEQE